MDLNKIINIEKWARTYLSDTLNKRAKLDTGKFCNATCNFCYYQKELRTTDFLDIGNAKILVNYLLDNGIEEIELSGGEPTKHPKILEMVIAITEVFKARNLTPKISIVTNGTCTHEKFLTLSPYIKEWLFSLHGSSAVHDKVVNVAGISPYNRLIEKLMYLISAPGYLARINFVVHAVEKNNEFISNLDYQAQRICIYLLSEGVQVNLLPLNFWKDAKNLNSSLEDTILIYASINEFITKVTKKFTVLPTNNLLMAPIINIRYPQFCLLSDDARIYARGHYDHIQDTHDWNKIYYPKDIDPAKKVLSTFNEDIAKLIYPQKLLTKEQSIDQASTDRMISHTKDKECRGCNFFNECDGLKKGTDSFLSIRKSFVTKKELDYFGRKIDKRLKRNTNEQF